MEYFLEEFDLSIDHSIGVLNPYDYFKECHMDHLELIKEATEGTNKKNIFQKLCSMIVKFFRWCGKLISRFINFIKGLFGRKTKTADQICEELKLTPNNSVVSQLSKLSKEDQAKSMKEKLIYLLSIDDKTDRVDMSSMVDVKSIVKPLSVALEGDGTIRLNINEMYRGYYLNHNADKHGEVHGHSDGPDRNVLILALLLIGNEHYLNNIIDRVNEIKKFANNEAEEWEVNSFGINNDIRSIDILGGKYIVNILNNQKEFKINIKQLTKLQNTVNELSKTFIDLLNKASDRISPRTIDAINDISSLVFRTQMGLNMISDCIQGVYTIDAKYAESITDLETFSKFIDSCISANIPGKYVAYNSCIVCSSNITGYANKKKPLWGQTRFVFFPTEREDLVYKIAYSVQGIHANKSELVAYDKLKSDPESKILSKPEKLTSSDSIIGMEKIDKIGARTLDEVHKMENLLDSLRHNNNLRINILSDVHRKNIGYRSDGQMVSIDYGSPFLTQ